MTGSDNVTRDDVYKLVHEWRKTYWLPCEVCLRTTNSHRPEGHDGECWPTEGKPQP